MFYETIYSIQFTQVLNVPHYTQSQLKKDAEAPTEEYKLSLASFIAHQNAANLQLDCELQLQSFTEFL